LLPTTVVGSYPQPDWLIDRRLLAADVPRIRRSELWRVAPAYLRQAQDDAAALAIRDMERAGIDVITDGEVRRESYSNHFATALEGLDADRPATITSRAGLSIVVPRVVGKIRRTRAVEVDAVTFLRRSTPRTIKVTLPGPFTMSQQVVDEAYRDPEALAMDFAAAVNEEAQALQVAGADVIQLDEPWLRNDPAGAERYAVDAINRALDGITATTVIHLCFGYAAVAPRQKPSGYPFLAQLAATVADAISIEAAQPKVDLGVLADLSAKGIVLGVLDLSDPAVETVDEVARRIRHGLRYVAADRLTPAPDCGMKYLRRAVAFGKLQALSEGARVVRAELGEVFPFHRP
jgi:5-methyltetrahydropteroyltriglutamate--homocysteine methyltransferase